jgi:hypothetical protein
MFKDLKNLVKSLIRQDIKLNIELLSDDILVPERTEEYNSFSIQGNLIIDSPISKRVNNIAILFSGNLVNFKDGSLYLQKSSIIHNQLEILSQPTEILEGISIFEFELALPRSLPSSTNSVLFELKYSLTALIEFENKIKLAKRVFVKVYNNYLLPLREIHQSCYENHGAAKDLVYWRIKFRSRIFNVEEFAKFKLKLEPRNATLISFINAKLLQESLIFSNASDLTEGEGLKPITQFISQCSINLVYKHSENTFEIELPITNSVIEKSILIPTMETQYFEISHRILIEVNYIPPGEVSNKAFSLNIPIAVFSNFKTHTSLDLPIYDNIGKNSIFFPIKELPPIYSV